jgi:hypothetical protein
VADDYRTDIKVPFPLLRGSSDLVKGYYELEEAERHAKLQAYGRHREEAALWYRGLSLYLRVFQGPWDFTDQVDETYGARVLNLRGQLFGLGICTVKAALDALLAGYYSVAFASIRHMIETVIQDIYLLLYPEEFVLWYADPGEEQVDKQTPSCWVMVEAIKQSPNLAEHGLKVEFIDELRKAWKLMSKGAHPTGEGINQTRSTDGSRLVFGAVYNRDYCLTGLDNGFFALNLLLVGLCGLQEQSIDWKAERASLAQEIGEWRIRTAQDLAQSVTAV